MTARTLAICALLLMLGACGKNPDAGDRTDPQGDHVWKSQTDMMDKARAIEDTVMEQSARQRQTIDEQAR
jgi:hypothetical protein